MTTRGLVAAAALALGAAAAATPPRPWRSASAPAETVVALLNRGLALLEQHDYGASAEAYAEAARLAPDHYPAHLDHGIALLSLRYLKRGEEAAVEASLRRAAALDAREPAPWYCLGMHLREGVVPPRTEEALRCFRRARSLAGGWRDAAADAAFREGLCLQDLGRVEEAERAFDDALRAAPLLGPALYARGQARVRLGRDAEGRADLEAFRDGAAARRFDARDASYGLMGVLAEATRDRRRWRATLPPSAEDDRRTPHAGDPGFGLDLPRSLPGAGRIQIVDLDGDGRLDLVASGPGAGWCRGLGDGRFEEAVPFPHASGPANEGLAAADLDGDGAMEILLGSAGVLRGAAGGAPIAAPFPASVPPDASLLVADLDADGWLDVACGDRVLWNDARGGLLDGGALPAPGPGWRASRLAFPADHAPPDLVGEDGVVLENLRGRTWRASPGARRRRTGLPKGEALLVDLDGRPPLDLLAWVPGGMFGATGGDGPGFLEVRLAGTHHPNGFKFGLTNRQGVGARVEVFDGDRVASARMGIAGPSARLLPPPDRLWFPLRGARADVVSVRWTEGIFQAERDVPAGVVTVPQTQRKSGW